MSTEIDQYPDPLDLQVMMKERVRSRRRMGPITGKLRFIKAMKGTRGNRRLIAENLRIGYNTVCLILQRPDWQDVKALLDAERQKAIDKAEDVVMNAIEGNDVVIATQNARWLLARLRPDQYAEKSTTVLEGGNNPIKVLQGVVDLNALNMPLEVKRQVLAALDAKQEAEREKELIPKVRER